MTYLVLVEPADEKRRDFARWCLDQKPPIMTTSASGSYIPSDLFVICPAELLDGAYVDGHIFRSVIDGMVPDGKDGYRPATPARSPRRSRGRKASAAAVPVDDGAQPEALFERFDVQ